jgi:RNA polymerase sigma factor (sigma-70 family)
MVDDNRVESSTDHEQIFVENYQQLLRFAQYICKGDTVAAEDLVQTAFIQFIKYRPPLDTEKNILGYLHRLIINVRKNQIVRSSRQKRGGADEFIDLPLIEELVASGDVSNEAARELLIEIAGYAAERRNRSKTGSVFILRFLLGYFPKEIAQIMRSSIFAVNNLIMRSRQELRDFLKEP